MPIFGPKCQFWAKFGRFWAQNPIFWGQGVKILVPSYRDSNETSFSCWKHWSVRLQLVARGKNVLFWPQNLDIWGQKSIFCLVIAIFVDGTNDHYTRGYNFPIGTTPKKFSQKLWEFRLPVKALALSARRPFGPARFARGLDKYKWYKYYYPQQCLRFSDAYRGSPPCTLFHHQGIREI